MPNKHNAARRHRMPTISFGVTIWPAYKDGLKQRGSMVPLAPLVMDCSSIGGRVGRHPGPWRKRLHVGSHRAKFLLRHVLADRPHGCTSGPGFGTLEDQGLLHDVVRMLTSQARKWTHPLAVLAVTCNTCRHALVR